MLIIICRDHIRLNIIKRNELKSNKLIFFVDWDLPLFRVTFLN